MPEAEDECVVDRLMLTKMDVVVGDTLHLRTQGTYADALARTEFTVVGVVQSPFYISLERGTSTLGTGQATAFLCLPESAFAMDYYTAAYLTVQGAAEEVAFSDAYQAIVDASVTELEQLAEVRRPCGGRPSWTRPMRNWRTPSGSWTTPGPRRRRSSPTPGASSRTPGGSWTTAGGTIGTGRRP